MSFEGHVCHRHPADTLVPPDNNTRHLAPACNARACGLIRQQVVNSLITVLLFSCTVTPYTGVGVIVIELLVQCLMIIYI